MNLIEKGAVLNAFPVIHEQIDPRYTRTTPLRSVLSHVSNPENVAPAEPGRKCGDGRYEGLDGKLARFGADGGYVLGLLSLNGLNGLGLTPFQIVDAVVETSEGKFSFHSDQSAETTNSLTSIGCGHLAKAASIEHARLYGVDPNEVVAAVAYMNYLAAESPDLVEKVVLRGAHKEQGVIINTGTEKKIRHGDGKNQWFVVGEAKDRTYTHELFGRLREILPQLVDSEITSQDFQRILDAQTQATAGILAKGLPMFRVNLDHELPFIECAGVV